MTPFTQSYFFKFSTKLLFLVIISFNVMAEDRPFIMNGFGDTPFQYIQQGLTHRGIDIRVMIGTPVIAASDGEVVWVEKGFDGRWIHPNIRIKHIDDVEVYYYHIDKIIVEHGQAVKQGQKLLTLLKQEKPAQLALFYLLVLRIYTLRLKLERVKYLIQIFSTLLVLSLNQNGGGL